MSEVWKVLGGALVTAILSLALRQQGKDTAMLLGIAAVAMVALVGFVYLKPVIEFVQTLQDISQVHEEQFTILLKSVGIGMVSEIASLICADSGNTALGKSIQIMASAVILWLSLPLMQSLLELTQQMLGEL